MSKRKKNITHNSEDLPIKPTSHIIRRPDKNIIDKNKALILREPDIIFNLENKDELRRFNLYELNRLIEFLRQDYNCSYNANAMDYIYGIEESLKKNNLSLEEVGMTKEKFCEIRKSVYKKEIIHIFNEIRVDIYIHNSTFFNQKYFLMIINLLTEGNIELEEIVCSSELFKEIYFRCYKENIKISYSNLKENISLNNLNSLLKLLDNEYVSFLDLDNPKIKEILTISIIMQEIYLFKKVIIENFIRIFGKDLLIQKINIKINDFNNLTNEELDTLYNKLIEFSF